VYLAISWEEVQEGGGVRTSRLICVVNIEGTFPQASERFAAAADWATRATLRGTATEDDLSGVNEKQTGRKLALVSAAAPRPYPSGERPVLSG